MCVTLGIVGNPNNVKFSYLYCMQGYNKKHSKFGADRVN